MLYCHKHKFGLKTLEPALNGVDPNTILDRMSSDVFEENALHIRTLQLCSTWKLYLTSHANIEERTFSELTSLVELIDRNNFTHLQPNLQVHSSYHQNRLQNLPDRHQ